MTDMSNLRRPMKVFINGKFVDEKKAAVSVFDHGLLYGDGVFEGIRCYPLVDGSAGIFRLQEHIERLYESAHIGLMEVELGPGRLGLCVDLPKQCQPTPLQRQN